VLVAHLSDLHLKDDADAVWLDHQLDRILARAQADAEFRQACSADLEAALARAGYAPDARSLAALRAQLSG